MFGKLSLTAIIFVGTGIACSADEATPVKEIEQPDTGQLENVEVFALTAMTGSEKSRDRATSSVQSANASELEKAHLDDVSAYLVRRMAGVQINEVQGNAWQADVTYRGFTASPLLGTPQGLSVYLDGVRLNQPFGEVVSWDIVPRMALARMELSPGSNPLFGMNTLGGALVLRTKDGKTDPGVSAELRYGTADRRVVEIQAGGSAAHGWHAYTAGYRFSERGWRDESPGDLWQSFTKLGWRSDAAEVSLTGAFSGSQLNGNGLQERRLLDRSWSSVYSYPDTTNNHSTLVSMGWTIDSSLWKWSGNMYHRDIDTETLNGDVNDDALGESLYQPTLVEQTALLTRGYSGFPVAGEAQVNTAFPSWRCIANALLNDEPNEKCDGLLNRTNLSQTDSGATLQGIAGTYVAGRPLTLVAGLSATTATIRFRQSSQFGYLDSRHSVIPVTGPGAYADGTQNSEGAFDARVDLDGQVQTTGLYVSSAYSLSSMTEINFSARHQRVRVTNVDLLTPAGVSGSLSGMHSFSRLDPAFAISRSINGKSIAYFNISGGSRTPSSIELGCADPDVPCRLPNSMAGDPPLKPVVTRTLEVGARSMSAAAFQWRANLFRADSRDDILFVASERSGYGYFRNVAATRRQGVELALAKSFGGAGLGMSYALLDATFQSNEIMEGASNSSSDAPAPGFAGEIEIDKGNAIPLLARHLFKWTADWQVTRAFALSIDGAYRSGMYARGNENNQHQPDGLYYLGRGKTGGYVIFNVGAELGLLPSLMAFVQVDNLFDRQYSTAAQLAPAAFDSAGRFVARPFAGPVIDGERPLVHSTFYSPGAPRLMTIGLRYRFGQQNAVL